MSDKSVLFFVKFFEKEEYADQFIKGQLYLNRLSYFKKIENNDDDGRPDTNEAVAMWLQPHDFSMTLNVPGIGETTITSTDLAAPVSMSFEHHNHIHILCLYAIITKNPASSDQQVSLAEQQADLQRQFQQLQIDGRCSKFGQFAVLIQAVPFLSQLKEVLQRNRQPFKGAVVKYYDDETFHGEIPPKDIPFWKQKRFSYQQEFRICVWTNTEGDNALTINIGDISPICVRKSDSAQLNDLLNAIQVLNATPGL